MVVYCTTNILNGKKYIGKDVRNSPSYLGSGTALTNAIKKYGKQNFKKQILAFCETKEQLKELEEYYIDYYGARKSTLFYNIAKGGDGGIVWEDNKCHRCIPIYEVDIKTKTVTNTFLSGKEAANFYNIPYKNINAVLNRTKKSVNGKSFVKDKNNIDWDFFIITHKKFKYTVNNEVFYNKQDLYKYLNPKETLETFKNRLKLYINKYNIKIEKNENVINKRISP